MRLNFKNKAHPKIAKIKSPVKIAIIKTDLTD